jgi:uncharacterized protein
VDVVLALTAGHLAGDLGRSLREAAYMFWQTLWALVLGFALSGAVQAFVSRQALQRRLGDHRPVAVVRASLYGMASSSCSYAATAMAKSLFQKGADLISALVFMFASTNLVVELGLVLVVLIGWQFAVAEYVGGVIMIVLLATLGTLVLSGERTEAARRRLVPAEGEHHQHEQHDHEHADHHAGSEVHRVRTVAGWADAASYTMADLTMLRREMIIGYLVAGFLAELVPNAVWGDLFIRHHGLLTDLENVVVGPLIAVISFVCSIGNVPLAAALWKGGISFGGVISFIFADLITFPLLLIYRRYYGTAFTIRLLGLFWLVMAAAGLAVEALFSVTGLLPSTRSIHLLAEHFGWDVTTFLDLAALIVLSALYGLYRNQRRLGGGQGYAIDPMCGMQVEIANAPALLQHQGETVYFCSDHCRHRFESQEVPRVV